MRQFFLFLIIFGLFLCLFADDEPVEEENPEEEAAGEPNAEPTSVKIGVLKNKKLHKNSSEKA